MSASCQTGRPLHVPGLFLTGTDTGVGKTYIAALVARELAAQGVRVGVYKPVASGCMVRGDAVISEDAVSLWEAAGRPGDLDHVCPQRFLAPLAPHLAAKEEGRRVDAELLRQGLDYWREKSEFLLVEGVGGLMTPLTDEEYVADLAAAFGFPLIVVSKNALGTINQTLQTILTAKSFREGLTLAGVILNQVASPCPEDRSTATNRRELESRCPCPILGECCWRGEGIDTPVDWRSLASPKKW